MVFIKDRLLGVGNYIFALKLSGAYGNKRKTHINTGVPIINPDEIDKGYLYLDSASI
jgi:hypothetical protein